jgi:hypothetical protein
MFPACLESYLCAQIAIAIADVVQNVHVQVIQANWLKAQLANPLGVIRIASDLNVITRIRCALLHLIASTL